MRTEEYEKFQAQGAEARQGVFAATAARLGITEFLAEKDFWVCRILDILMKEPPWIPKRFFKGGTSLSKAYGLIKRFSEDIDIVFNRNSLACEAGHKFKDDLDPANPDAPFESNNQRMARFEELKAACSRHMHGDLKSKLEDLMPECRIVTSDADPQTLFVRYPSLFNDVDLDANDDEEEADYFLPRVKIEGGSRSAQAPTRDKFAEPYIQTELKEGFNLGIERVTVIAAERTFLEKISIIHGVNCRFRDEERLPEDRHRMSRHFYDLALMAQHRTGQRAMDNRDLLTDVREHNQLAFRSAWRRHEELVHGQIQLIPRDDVSEALRRDYVRMQDMIFGERPTFDWILERLREIDVKMNPML